MVRQVAPPAPDAPLFGSFGLTTPDMLDAQRAQQMQQQLAMGQQSYQNPQQQGANASGQALGMGLGMLAKHLFHMKDPEAEQAKNNQNVLQAIQVMSGGDANKALEMAAQIGLPGAREQYMAFQKGGADLEATNAKAAADRAAAEASGNKGPETVEIGVAGNPDRRQKAKWDPTTKAFVPIGEPYNSKAMSVNVGGDKQESEIDKLYGKKFVDLQTAGEAALQSNQQLDRFDALAKGVSTGKLTPLGTQIASYANAVGLPVDKNLGNKQAMVAISNQLALAAKNAGGTNQMAGSLSDSDRRFLAEMVPSLANQPGGNDMIIETLRRANARTREVAQAARDYYRKNGKHFDDGFDQYIEDKYKDKPLFDDLVKKAGGFSDAPTPQTVNFSDLPKGR